MPFRSHPSRSIPAPSWLLLASALASCGGAKTAAECEQPDRLEVMLRPALELNSDREGQPRSVVVHVHQLKSPEGVHGLTAATYWSEEGAEGLGPDALGKPLEVIVVPGRPELRTIELAPEAEYLAMIANFRQTESQWKTTVRLPPERNPCDDDLPVMRVHVDLTGYQIQGALRMIDPKAKR